MSAQDSVPSVIPKLNDAEVTFYQQLDLQKQEQAHELEMEKIKASARVKLERQKTRQQFLNLIDKNSVLPWIGGMLACLAAAGVIAFAVWGIWAMATSGPPKSVEQIQIEKKHDRFKKCADYNGTDNGAHDNIWYPTAQGGEGLCLPKDKPAPATP